MMRPVATALRRVKWFGFRRYCPACGSHVRAFLSYGIPPRPDARCPVCNSSERERAQVLLLRNKVVQRISKRRPLRVLHVAPERGVERALRRFPHAEYVSGDLEAGRAMRVVDLTALDFADASLDFIFASHVLEHIADDGRALAEMYRVLAPGGIAFVEVPALRRETYEDATIVTAEARLKEFGQVDHVRICGLDYVDRLVRAGFSAEPLSVAEQFTPEELGRMRLCVDLPPEIVSVMPARYEQHFDIVWLCKK